MREILPGVLTWPRFSAKDGDDFDGDLFVGQGGNLAVDSVEMPPPVLCATFPEVSL